MEDNIEGAADDIPDSAPEAFTGTKDARGYKNIYLMALFHEVEHYLQHVKTVKSLDYKLNDFSLIEMMKLFKGCCSQMHMMKNKSIKEGFKF